MPAAESWCSGKRDRSCRRRGLAGGRHQHRRGVDLGEHRGGEHFGRRGEHVDGRGIFVQRDGVHVYELVYDFESNDYRATSLTLFNDEIGGTGIAELAIQRSPENYIWAARDDGIAVVMLYDVKEKAAGWFKHIAGPSLAGREHERGSTYRADF